MSFLRGFFCGLIWVFSSYAYALNASNCRIAQDLISNFDQPLPSHALVDELFFNSLITREDFDDFERAVIEFYELSPESRNIADLVQALGIPESRALELLLYYNLDDSLSLIKDEGLQIYSGIRRRLFIHRHAFRMHFYQKNITRFSVEELARELGVTEGNVYKQLFIFDISIVGLWERPLVAHQINDIRTRWGNLETPLSSSISLLSLVRGLRGQGESSREISRILGVSLDALTAILHHLGIEPRGETWSIDETQLLVELYHTIPIADIALRLRRTEGSVVAKAGELNLRHPITIRVMDVDIAPYGRIKEDGRFNRGPLRAFLMENMDQPTSILSTQLGCHKNSIRSWKLKFGLFTPRRSSAQLTRPDISQSALALRSRYEYQNAVVSACVDRVAEGDDLPSTRDSFVRGFSYDKTMASGRYSLTGDFHHIRVFNNKFEFLIAVSRHISRRIDSLKHKSLFGGLSTQETSHLRNLESFSIFDVPFSAIYSRIPPALRAIFDLHRIKEQQNLVDKAVAHLAEGNHVLSRAAFIPGVNYAQATSVGKVYQVKSGIAGDRYHYRIFENPYEMWLKILPGINARIQALDEVEQIRPLTDIEVSNRENLRRLSVFDIVFSNIPDTRMHYYFDQHRHIEGQILTHAISDQIMAGNPVPANRSEFNKTFGILFEIATGGMDYEVGKNLSHRRIFDSIADLWAHVDQEVSYRLHLLLLKKESGDLTVEEATQTSHLQSFSIFDIRFQNVIDPATLKPLKHVFDKHRRRLQEDILNKLVFFIAAGKGVPRELCFLPNENYERITAQGAYSQGKSQWNRRVFDSNGDMWVNLVPAIRARISELEIKRESVGLDPNEKSWLVNLQAFTIFDVTISLKLEDPAHIPTVKSLFDSYRPEMISRFLTDVKLHIVSHNVIPQKDTFPEGYIYQQVTGTTSNFKSGGRYHHRRFFDSTRDMWAQILQMAIIEKLPNHIITDLEKKAR